MQIAPFAVEEWMNRYETQARCNIAETCVDSISLDELLALCQQPRQAFLDQLAKRPLTYGDIVGSPEYLEGICSLYRTIQPQNILSTHGAAGANHLLFYSLIEPGDRVISVTPTYQQLYSIPSSFGAEVVLLPLRPEEGWLPNLDALRRLAADGAKMICINNPNNPTGALMEDSLLEQIVEIARSAGAYLLCDEVYRGLNQDGSKTASVADLYEKGISIGSMSKVFSMAGIRLGWIATQDETGMVAAREVDGQVGVSFHLYARVAGEKFAQGFDALVRALERLLTLVDAHADDNAVEEREPSSEQRLVPFGERVETSGKDGYSFHSSASLFFIIKGCPVRRVRRFRHGLLPPRGCR